MTLPALVTAEELGTWIGADLSGGDARADAILSAASTLVRNTTHRVWVDEEDETEEGVTEEELATVKLVVTLVAERVYSNPRGITSKSAGPFSETVAAWAAYGMALTQQEAALLASDGTTSGVPGLTSIRVEAPRYAAGVARPGIYD